MPRSYSDEKLIEAMRDLAADLGEKPTQREMRLEGPYSINAYKRAFGSWNEAVAAAGFEPRRGSNPVPAEDLLDDLQRLAETLGRTPTQSEVREQGQYSVGAYYTHFGSLNAAKEELGLELNHEQNVERVSVACAWCGEELERLPSEVEDAEYSYCSQACVNQHKQERYAGEGNPRSTLSEVACAACGATIKRPRWKRESNDRHFCSYECMGDWREGRIEGENHPQWKEFPTLECEWCGKSYSVKPAEQSRSRFCSTRCKWESRSEAYSGEGNPSWKGGGVELTCRHCGDEYTVKQAEAEMSKYCSASCRMSSRTGEDHPRWNPDSERVYYGANWVEQRQRAIRRDHARCQAPGCGRTEAESVTRYGLGLDVHHLTPIREFKRDGEIDHNAANALDNLLTLCRECHIKTDTGSLDLSAK